MLVLRLGYLGDVARRHAAGEGADGSRQVSSGGVEVHVSHIWQREK